MSVFEIEYVDVNGHHAEAIEGWDQEDAVQTWRAQHSGQKTHLLDVVRLGEVEEVEA